MAARDADGAPQRETAPAPTPAQPLPPGRYFALAWNIPNKYGGLTSAMLHRSRAFVRLGGMPVDILTFDHVADPAEDESRLRERGEMLEGMRLVNLWDWLRDHDPEPTKRPLGAGPRVFTPLDPSEAFEEVGRNDRVIRRTRFAADGKTVLQHDTYRDDGTLLVSDRQDVNEYGTPGGRSVVLCGRDGRPARSWGSIWGLYRYWLDEITEGAETSFLIADSKPVSRFLRTYRRPGRVTVPVVHGSHLRGSITAWGRLRPAREDVMRHLADYDAVVFLTERQRRDALVRFGRHENLCVIPNSRTLRRAPALDRPRTGGVMVGALSRLKRPEHAMRAVLLARRMGAPESLDNYGGGARRAKLDEFVAKRGAERILRLHGYQPDARDRLAEASFLLFTSRSEGFGLVLLEAMAKGCIPIAYDIRYGPAEMIENGRNGFLVTPGNVLGLARAIVKLHRMPEGEVTRMRQAARRTAERYSDEALIHVWGEQLAAARDRNREALGLEVSA